MGSLIAHRIDYNGVAALTGQRHIPSKNKPKYPALVFCSKLGVIRAEERVRSICLLHVQVAVEGKGWMVVVIYNYDYGIF